LESAGPIDIVRRWQMEDAHNAVGLALQNTF
jgi:hypothetical protein